MKRVRRRMLLSVGVVTLVLFAAFWVYTSDYYRAELPPLERLLVPGIELVGEGLSYRGFAPVQGTEIGFVFYPGGKVEHTAYLPLLQRLAMEGILAVVTEMPFNLAVFRQSAADRVLADFPDIRSWYIGGHSLGGAMASSYLGRTSHQFRGLVLLGAYPTTTPTVPSLTIYGSEDKVLSVDRVSDDLDPLVIAGGNHAHFGNYGEQAGDGRAQISRAEQQQQTVTAILDFISQTQGD